MAAAGNGRVWSLRVRLAHWGLAAAVAVAWLTDHGPPWLHDSAGYAALALVVLRLLTGLFGPPADRFARFLAGPRATLSYAGQVFAGKEPRFLGHNPLGGWMIVALLAVTAGAGVTGWLYTTNQFWGVRWVAILHSSLADVLLFLVGFHIAGVVFTSVRQGENLVAAMLHGRKPPTTRRHPESPADAYSVAATRRS